MKYLVKNKFMSEIHLRQSGLTYSAYGPFTKHKEGIHKFKETEDLRYIYQNELDKACFQHEMADGDFKDLTRRIASIKYCMIKHLIFLRILSMTDIKEV